MEIPPPRTFGASVVVVGEVLRVALELGAGLALAALFGWSLPPERAWQFLPASLVAWTLVLVLGARVLSSAGIETRVLVPWKPPRPLPPWFLAAAVVVVAGLIPLISLPDAVEDSPLFASVKGTADRIALALYAVTVAPLAEELWYRGFVYSGVARTFGPRAAIGLVGLWFGLVHAPQYQGAPFGIASVCVMGVAMTWIRHRTGAVAPCVAVHAAHNAVGALGLLMGG